MNPRQTDFPPVRPDFSTKTFVGSEDLNDARPFSSVLSLTTNK